MSRRPGRNHSPAFKAKVAMLSHPKEVAELIEQAAGKAGAK
jgi:hypothetical protein